MRTRDSAATVLALAFYAAFLGVCIWYARSKGRHWAWGVAGLFGIVGLLILMSLKSQTTPHA